MRSPTPFKESSRMLERVDDVVVMVGHLAEGTTLRPQRCLSSTM